MTLRTGNLVLRAGNLTKDPECRRFVNADGTYTDVMYLRMAVDHDGYTEYVDLEAKGMVRLYLEAHLHGRSHNLHKGSYLIGGGCLVRRAKRDDLLKLQVVSAETSMDYKALDYDYLER